MLSSRERIDRILRGKPVDRIGLYETFWPEALAKWRQQGFMPQQTTADDHFDLDIRRWGAFKFEAQLDFKQVLEETAETILVKDGNGAIMRTWKNKCGTPEHVDFTVKDRRGWEELIRPKLLDKDAMLSRIDFAGYKKAMDEARAKGKFFCASLFHVFEAMHRVCGHEYMLMGMALDPDWVRDMCDVYSNLIIELSNELFAKEGKPDGFWMFEDMGFKNKPFMSPTMYRDIIFDAHKKTFDFAHSLDLPVILHSCGYVEPLVPGLIEAGIDCLQAMEVKAGMDLVHLAGKFGDKIAFCGGIDIRVLESNDRDLISITLDNTVGKIKDSARYILHSDHSVPDRVNYESYKYFVEKGIEAGRYS